MVPTQQRLQSDDSTRTQFHLRLVVELQLAALGRTAKFVGDYHALLDLMVEVSTVKTEAIAAVLFGAIESKIRLDHHGIGPGYSPLRNMTPRC